MAFFTRSSRRVNAALLFLWIGFAHGASFTVITASTRLHNGSYLLNARLDFRLSAVAEDALANGVPLTVIIDIDIRRQRNWLWDESILTHQERRRLAYDSLTTRFVVTNTNAKIVRSFNDLTAALRGLGDLRDLPLVLPTLAVGERYNGRLRTRLDLTALPGPLRTNSLFSSDWQLESEWYQWQL